MKAAIHQPHYFPWIGYMDKMAKAEKFIILDEVQLVDGSPMLRNKFLNVNGMEAMLSLSVCKKGRLEKETKDIVLFEIERVQKRHKKFLEYNYKRTPFFNEIMEHIEPIFCKKYHYLVEINVDTICLLKDMLGITTKLIYQSQLSYDKEGRKSDLLISLCQAVKADIYLSGNGARKYMDVESFERKGIKVIYQNFAHPVYQQTGTEEFVSNLSALDMLFQVGINRGRDIFWENVQKGREFEEIRA